LKWNISILNRDIIAIISINDGNLSVIFSILNGNIYKHSSQNVIHGHETDKGAHRRAKAGV
jgi:hypothetical protein